jgi:hypothetical protein
MSPAVIVLGAVALLAAAATGALGCWLLVNHRIESRHAAMTASRADTGPYRRALAEQHRAAWRAAVRHWVHLHLPHWRAAA